MRSAPENKKGRAVGPPFRALFGASHIPSPPEVRKMMSGTDR
jgi:hypothetical protein